MALQYMFLGQLFAKNTKNDPKTLFEKSKSAKNKNSENGQIWLFSTCFMS